MTEVRSGDVLRLFFGKEHKNYVVGKVGKDFLKLLIEGGSETIVHKDGLLVREGLTGFEVIRNKKFESEFSVGSYVQVHLHSGNMIVGDVVDNEDGLLTIHTTVGPTIYIDLETQGDAVKMVVLAESLDDFETFDTSDLPEGLPELLVVKLQPTPDAAGRRVALRLHQPTPSDRSVLPKWFVPVGDPKGIHREILITPEDDAAFFQKLANTPKPTEVLRSVTVKKENKSVTLPTAVVFHDLANFASGKVIKSDVEVFAPKIPLKYYAAVQTLLPMSRLFLPATDLAVKVRLHRTLHKLFAGWRDRTKAAPRFKTLSQFLKQHAPRATGPSRYEAVRALEPYQLPYVSKKNVRTNEKVAARPADLNTPTPPGAVVTASRYAFGKTYGHLLQQNLFTSESLAQILNLDYGRLLFQPSAGHLLQSLLRIRQGSVWERERVSQRLKNAGSKISPYEPNFIALLNHIGENLPPTTEEKAAAAFSLLSKYTREPTEEEDSGWLYHATSGEKLVPVAVEKLVRTAHLQGKYGYAAFLETFHHVEDGFFVDVASGAILGKRQEQETGPTSNVPEKGSLFNDTAYDISLVNLLESLCCRLGVSLGENRNLVMKRSSWKTYNVSASAYTVAGYVAYYGGKSSGAVAEAFRHLVTSRRDLHMFSEATSVSDLSNLIKAQTENAERFDLSTGTTSPCVSENGSEKHEVADWVQASSSPELVRLGKKAKREHLEFRSPEKAEIFPSPNQALETPELKEELKRKVLARFPKAKLFLASADGPSAGQLSDFLRVLTTVIPALLSNKKRHFRNLNNLMPQGSTPAMADAVKALYAPTTAIETDDSAESSFVRFSRSYAKHKKNFAAIAASAHAAGRRGDLLSLRTCVMSTLYLYFEADYGKELIQQDDRYVAAVVEAAMASVGVKIDD